MASMAILGVTQWSLDPPGPESLAAAAYLGFAAIHIDAGDLDSSLLLDSPALRERYRQAAAATGVRITAIAPGYVNGYGLGSPAGSENGRKCRRLIRIAVEAAADLGVPLVFLPSFRAGEIRDDLGLQQTAQALGEACDLAAGHGLAVATENTLGLSGNLELLRAAGRPNLRVLLDTQNPALWGHPVAPLVEGLWPRLGDQVHVKDGAKGQMGNAVLGEGESGFDATAHALRSRGFDGVLISENDYLGERRAFAERDIAVLRELFA
jgi:L-ribulose-5-phosphate 3-epimerase